MEINDQAGAVDNSEQTTSSELEQQAAGTTTSPARSYECTFCKRGFSNAQALGGHMNIHRRDKAKLKQPSSSNNKSTVNIPSSYPPTLVMADAPAKWPWVINQDHNYKHDHHDDDDDDDHGIGKRDQTHVGEIKKLALFDEKPTQTDQSYNQLVVQGCSAGSGDDDDDDQLDLELRLGPDRSQDSSPTMTTKKFF